MVIGFRGFFNYNFFGFVVALCGDFISPSLNANSIWKSFLKNEPRHEKIGFLHMRKQRRRSASR